MRRRIAGRLEVTLDEVLSHPALRGVAVGACISGDPAALQGEFAHAHWRPGRGRGWICLESVRQLNRTTLTHELAHIIVGSDAHFLSERGGAAWQRMVRQLGGRVERRYLKEAS
jgi:hypothetical protein